MTKYLVIGIILVALAFALVLSLSKQTKSRMPENELSVADYSDTTYKGQEGKNAMELLLLNATVGFLGEGADKRVITINKHRVDEALGQRWAFFINGERSALKPESYITKTNDTLSWKIVEE